jgi:quinol monooxygenase YgiN
MLRRALGCVALVAAVAAAALAAPGPRALVARPALALKSHHLLNLPPSVTEADFVAVLRGMNAAVAAAEYPNAGYRLWKVTGKQAGGHAYLLEGDWPSQAAYDSIHTHPAYRAAAERARSTIQAAQRDQVYNRYIEVPLGKPAAE